LFISKLFAINFLTWLPLRSQRFYFIWHYRASYKALLQVTSWYDPSFHCVFLLAPACNKGTQPPFLGPQLVVTLNLWSILLIQFIIRNLTVIFCFVSFELVLKHNNENTFGFSRSLNILYSLLFHWYWLV
jgi:hypothetical protein